MIVLVAGITRSGLSLTMQMLDAGGFPVSGEYPAYEPDGIGAIPWDTLNGKAVKVVDLQLQPPPPGDYKVIYLKRNAGQQARSIKKFAETFGFRRGNVRQIVKSVRADYSIINKLLKPYVTMTLHFENLITFPYASATLIESFLGVPLDKNAMTACVIERTPDCYPTLLEFQLLDHKKELTHE